jgi:hypothetical protein
MRVFMSALRIGIAVALINAVARTALVYWSFYQFEDAAQQLAIFGWNAAPETLRSTVAVKALEFQVPITPEEIDVTREGPITVISANYKHVIEYFPRQKYPLQMSFRVEGRNLSAGMPTR